MSKLGMPCSVLSSLHFPTSVMWCFCLSLTFSHLFSCLSPPLPLLFLLAQLFPFTLSGLPRKQAKENFEVCFGHKKWKEATLCNSDASWTFFCGFGDVCDFKCVTRDEGKKKYWATSLCFHSPYHGLWLPGIFSKRLTIFFLNSHQRRAKKWTNRRCMWSLSDSVLCATFDQKPKKQSLTLYIHSLRWKKKKPLQNKTLLIPPPLQLGLTITILFFL